MNSNDDKAKTPFLYTNTTRRISHFFLSIEVKIKPKHVLKFHEIHLE